MLLFSAVCKHVFEARWCIFLDDFIFDRAQLVLLSWLAAMNIHSRIASVINTQYFCLGGTLDTTSDILVTIVLVIVICLFAIFTDV